MDIWDVHCHFSSVPGRTPEERMMRILPYADRMGITRLCVHMGMNLSFDPSPAEFRQQNDEVLQILRRWPERFFGFVHVNPKHEQESVAELDRCIRDGPMVGVKLWTSWHARPAALDAVVRRATELQAVVLQHTWVKVGGNITGEPTPMEFAVLAARHPQARLICGHVGGDWELGIRAVQAHRHVVVELGGGDPVADVTGMAVRELGAERIIFGSDSGAGRSFASQLAKVVGARVPDKVKRLILAGNLQRLLDPILKTKGVRV